MSRSSKRWWKNADQVTRDYRFITLIVMPNRIYLILKLVTVALAMTVLFWWPLYQGAGFIGGDLYPYFFPQKAFYADCLKAGVFPLWNDLTGFGYPILGESQTGAAYPFHVVLYRCFDLNTAYNIEHLLHYVICFVATALFANRLGLKNAGALLTAIVFTYGWFPPRACLEWAILTGAWLPVALWCVESFLQTGKWRYAIGLSVATGFQLLAGHYHLAFITELLVVTYSAWRLFNKRRPQNIEIQTNGVSRCRTRAGFGLAFALIAGACLASVQLLPTWELKQRSSRVVSGSDYDPAYGHMPPLYASQMITPWYWYSLWNCDEDHLLRDVAEFAAPWHWFGPTRDPDHSNQVYDLDQAIQKCRFTTTTTGTNKVEAHLYCGFVPVVLAIWAMIIWFRHRRGQPGTIGQESVMDMTTGYWLIAGLIALVYATAILLPIGRHLPGFSFFRGPGRYGIITTLTIALLAGQMFGRLMTRISTQTIRILVMILVFGSTCGDLWLVSRMVKYTVMVYPPRINFRSESEVRKRLLAEPIRPRLLAPGPNVGNLLGVSCVPWYLGIAPAEYVDPQYAMPPKPKPLANQKPTPGTPELIEWLSRSGVTHVLNFEPLDEKSWQAELVWKGFDPLINRVWAREEPIHLYRFRPGQSDGESKSFPGRAYIVEGKGRVLPPEWNNDVADSRRVLVESDNDGNALLVLTELAYPGWVVQNGQTTLDAKSVGMFRAVTLPNGTSEVTWSYRPRSVYYGAVISLVTIVLLASIAHMRFWHPRLVDFILGKLFRRSNSCGTGSPRAK